jgi:hypothetical protein
MSKTKKYRKIQNKHSRKIIGGNKAGIFDVIGDSLSQYTGKATKYIKDKSLRLIGLEPIHNEINNDIISNNNISNNNISNNNISNNNISNNNLSNSLSSTTSKLSSDIVNVADKSSAAIIANVNDVLQNPKVGESISEVSKESTEILKNLNNKLITPELKEETKLAMDNIADYVEIGVTSMDKPIDDAIDQLNNASTKAISGIGSGIIKVGTDLLAAVPGVGAIVEAGKIINDVSSAVGNVAEAASDAASTMSKVVDETSLNINSGLKELHDNKKIANQISSRTNDSIHTFIHGGNKTKRRLFKNKNKIKDKNKDKIKTKRVRFA